MHRQTDALFLPQGYTSIRSVVAPPSRSVADFGAGKETRGEGIFEGRAQGILPN